MLARFFNKSQPISFVSLLLLLFIFVVIHTLLIQSTPIGFGFFIQIISRFLFFTLLVFFMDFIVSKNHLTQSNFYAILFFVLLLGLFPAVFTISKISFSHLFILLASRRFYSIQTKRMLLSKLYDSGLYMGIAFLLNPESILFFSVIYIGYFIYIRAIDKSLFLPILGFATPIFILFTYYFVFDNINVFKSIIEINVLFAFIKNTSLGFLAPLLLIALMLIFSLFKILSNFQSFEREDKDHIKLIIAHLVISVLFISLNNIKIEENIQFLFFPSAILFCNLFYVIKKNWKKDIILYGLLFLSILLPFIPN